MCGILGIMASKETGLTREHYDAFLKGWEQAQDRGTDACGYIVSTATHLGYWKGGMPSRYGVEAFKQHMPFAPGWKFIIAHTRFATSGSPSDNRNNHPIIIGKNKDLMGVHNGMIRNKAEILRKHGWKEHREVDSEIAFRLILHYGKKSLKPFELMHGSFNLAYAFLDDINSFWLVRHDNPLTLRKGADYTAFGSYETYWNDLAGENETPEDNTVMQVKRLWISSKKFVPHDPWKGWRYAGGGRSRWGGTSYGGNLFSNSAWNIHTHRYETKDGKKALVNGEWQDIEAPPETERPEDSAELERIYREEVYGEHTHDLSDGDSLVFNPMTSTYERRSKIWPE